MKSKKTIKVEYLKTLINEKLSINTLMQRDKMILCCVIEKILMQTNNYNGFGYSDIHYKYNENKKPFFDYEYNKTHEYDRIYY